MRLVELKCNSCGATIKNDEYSKQVCCPYCGTVYYVKKESSSKSGFTFSLTELTDSLFGSSSSEKREEKQRVNAPPRPNLNSLIFIILLIFCVPIGLLYLFYVRHTQFQWDRTFAKRTGQIPKRPELNLIALIILFIIGVAPGVIYLVYTLYMQKEWDKEFS